MPAILILRWIYLVYFVVLMLLLIIMVSRFLFAGKSWRFILQSTTAAIFWPIAIFSKEGRNVLTTIWQR